jgi:hypothetical protein
MKHRMFAALLIVTASAAHGGTILVGTDNTGTSGGNYVGNQGDLFTDSNSDLHVSYGNLAWAQQFILNQAAVASDVSVWVSYVNVPSTFTLEITDGLSAGADVLFSGTGTFGSTPAWVDLNLSELALSAGTYDLVMTSGTPVPVVAPDGSNCPVTPPSGPNAPTITCFQTGLWGSDGTDISTEGSVGQLFIGLGGGANDSPGLALSSINIAQPGDVDFQLNSDAAATPEPGTLMLLMGGALALLAKRKLAR